MHLFKMVFRMKTVLATTLLVLNIKHSTALNIVVIAAIQTVSHHIIGNSLTNLLLDRGHHVYELTTHPPMEIHPNRTSFVAETGKTKFHLELSEVTGISLSYNIMFYAQLSIHMCKEILDSRAARDLLAFARDDKRPHIDVVVHDYIHHECLGPFASEFAAPYVSLFSVNSVQVDELMGGPIFPGFIPHDFVIHPFDQPLGWLKRLENKWAYLISHYGRYFIQYPQMDIHSKEFFGEKAPTIDEVRNTVSVALVNSHPAIQGSRPQLPSVVQVGGYHVPLVKELSAGKMKDFLDDAKDGFILICFGSLVPVSKIEPWRRQALVKAFKRLHPVRILMKWELPWNTNLDGPLPDNVLVSSWIPQSDVIGHSNIRAFVTHCGGLSTNEIIDRAVPIIAVPFFADQHINANKLIALNVGIMLPYRDINEETFYKAVRNVLDDKQYTTAIRQLSSFYHDQIETPQERVVFWIEFVSRHKTFRYLRSPGELMPFIARWMIDDLIIAVIVVIILLFVIRRTVRGALLSKTRSKQVKAKKS